MPRPSQRAYVVPLLLSTDWNTTENFLHSYTKVTQMSHWTVITIIKNVCVFCNMFNV